MYGTICRISLLISILAVSTFANEQPAPKPDTAKLDRPAASANSNVAPADQPAALEESERFNLNRWRRIPDPIWGLPSTGIYPLPGSNLNVAPEPLKK
jgi:hypothetical protein